jgi:hypothetical protein
MGFMLAEIALLQRFSVYLGHPIYSLGVSLFSLILASGLGSLTSDWLKLDARTKLLVWGIIVVVYLVAMERFLPTLLQSTTDQERLVRIGISLMAIMPLGFLLGFAFPTGMRLVEAVDRQPTPWFWGINGATGVLSSVLGVMFQHVARHQRDPADLCGLLSLADPDELRTVRRGTTKAYQVFQRSFESPLIRFCPT